MNWFTRLATLVLALASSGLAQAQVEVFTDRDAWMRAVGSFREESFADRALEGVAISEVGPGHGWGLTNALYDDRVVGAESYTVISFETGTTAFGAWWDLSLGGLGQGLQLALDGLPVGPEIPNTFHGFFGFTSATPFDAVLVFGGSQGGVAESYRLDNLVYAAPVPEPQTYLLMLAGLIAIGLLVSRRMK